MAVIVDHDDRPPTGQLDSVETYAREQALQSEADVLEGLRELDGAEGVRWHIYRINSTDPSHNGFLDRWGTTQLTQENLRDKFGPGTYKVRGHYPNGTYAAHRTIEIAGDAPRREKDTKPVGSTSGSPTDVTQLFVMLDQRDERRRAEDAARRDEQNAFWKSLAMTLAPIVAPKILDIVTGNNKPGTVTELLTGLKELRALDQPANGRNSIKELLETFNLMRESFDGGGPKPGEKGLWDVLTELAKGAGPKIGSVLEALPNVLNASKPNLPMNALPVMRVISSSPPNSVPAASPSPSPAPVTDSHSALDAAVGSVMPLSTNSDANNSSATETIPSQTSETNPTLQNGDDMNLALIQLIPYMRKQLELLVLKASRNSDPALYADLMLDNLPESVTPRVLLDFLMREDWWTLLQQFDARVEPYSGWFKGLRDELLQGLQGLT